MTHLTVGQLDLASTTIYPKHHHFIIYFDITEQLVGPVHDFLIKWEVEKLSFAISKFYDNYFGIMTLFKKGIPSLKSLDVGLDLVDLTMIIQSNPQLDEVHLYLNYYFEWTIDREDYIEYYSEETMRDVSTKLINILHSHPDLHVKVTTSLPQTRKYFLSCPRVVFS